MRHLYIFVFLIPEGPNATISEQLVADAQYGNSVKEAWQLSMEAAEDGTIEESLYRNLQMVTRIQCPLNEYAQEPNAYQRWEKANKDNYPSYRFQRTIDLITNNPF